MVGWAELELVSGTDERNVAPNECYHSVGATRLKNRQGSNVVAETAWRRAWPKMEQKEAGKIDSASQRTKYMPLKRCQ
jgi:hypothetical protein